jgi:hypothetical protein
VKIDRPPLILSKMEDVEGGVRLYSAEIDSCEHNEFPGDRIKDAGVMVEMFLK